MDILIKHWLPISSLLLAAIACAVCFSQASKKLKQRSRKRSILLFTLSLSSLLFSVLLAAFVLSVGGSLELLLPLLLIVMFFALL